MRAEPSHNQPTGGKFNLWNSIHHIPFLIPGLKTAGTSYGRLPQEKMGPEP